MGQGELTHVLDDALTTLDRAFARHAPHLHLREVGTVTYSGHGIARVRGLPGVRAEELLQFTDRCVGMAFNLDPHEVGAVLFGDSAQIQAGSHVYRTGRTLDVPVGDALLGRVTDATGRPLDAAGQIRTTERRPIERRAPEIMDRAPVTTPLQTGITVVDALVPIGRGQRELIVGDRQTGKTALALDTILNQHDQNVICVYCAIGQRSAAVAKLIADLRKHDALRYSLVVASTGEDAPGLQFITPYAATTLAEYFMERGRDVLIVYDDLTHHARAYRELALLLRRPPGREAFPGDIFYIHSRLLERATHLRAELGGGSLTALPIVETEAQNISAYIPTNLISITDGQIYLSPELFQKGILPAVDVGKSVSRVGGKAQLPAYRAVAGDLRLAYTQFQALELFARFGTQLDEATRATLERGRRVREILKQSQYTPISAPEQIAVLLAASEGLLDNVPPDKIHRTQEKIYRVLEAQPEIRETILRGETLNAYARGKLLPAMREAIE